MSKIVYRPQPGAAFVAPQLTPGQVLEVSHAEAEHLVGTGAFEFVDMPAAPSPEVTEGAKPERARKEPKHG